MNTTFAHSVRSLSPLSLALLLLLVIIGGACTKSNEDDSLELLSTVPADASAVAVLNLNTIVDRCGGSVKDGKITDPGKLDDLARKMLKADQQKVALRLLSPESGIECSSAVYFAYRGQDYLYALVADEEALRKSIDALWPGEWLTTGKVTHKNRAAICNGRFLLLPNADASVAETFANLSEPESFSSNEYAATLAKSTDAMCAWATIEGMMKASSLSFSEQTMAKMALGMSFNSPKYLTATANIDSDGTTVTASILDANMKPAKCELQLSKLDTKLIASLGGNANTVVAASVSEKLVKQFVQLAQSFGGNMPQAYNDALGSLDGTVVIALSEDMSKIDSDNVGYKGAIQTNGKNNATLLQALEAFTGKATIDGNTFLFGNEGYGNGIAPLADVAKRFEGAWLGVATAVPVADTKETGCLYLTLIPDGNSLKLKAYMQVK